MKRILSILLTIILLGSVLLSCKDRSDENESTSSTESSPYVESSNESDSESESGSSEAEKNESSSDTSETEASDSLSDSSEAEESVSDSESSESEESESSVDLTYTEDNALLLSGENKYCIIYDSADNKSLALKIKNKLEKLDGSENAEYTIGQKGDEVDDAAYEILIGATGRTATSDAKALLKTSLDYSILVTDNKIAIYAEIQSRLSSAITYFVSMLAANEIGQVFYIGDDSYIDEKKSYKYPSLSIDGTQISDFSFIIPQNADATTLEYAEKLAELLMTNTGAFIELKDDSSPISANEIIFGNTNREESIALAIDENDINGNFRISVDNGKMMIVANTANGFAAAQKSFSNAMTQSSGAITSDISVDCLSFEELKSITAGVVDIKNTKKGLSFLRCSEAQTNAWIAYSTSLSEGSTQTAGVKLDFHTDSKFFALCIPDGGARNFELFINGERENIKISTSDYYKKDLNTENGENRITLIFPSFAVGMLSSVQLSEGATLTPHEYDYNMMFIGDSITHGHSASPDSSSYAHITSRNLNANSLIQGIGGSYFAHETLDPELSFDPDVVIIAYGCNDWSRHRNSEANFRAAVTAYLDKVKTLYGDKTVVGISPISRLDNRPETELTFEKACAIIKEEYEKRGFTVLDGQELIPADSNYYQDVLHPNSAGYAVYAENLTAALQTILKG